MCAALVSTSDSSRMGSPSSTGVTHASGLGPFALNLGLRPRSDPSILNIPPPPVMASRLHAANGTNLQGDPSPDVLLALLSRNRALEGKIFSRKCYYCIFKTLFEIKNVLWTLNFFSYIQGMRYYQITKRIQFSGEPFLSF